MSIERNVIPRLEPTEKRIFMRPDGEIARSKQMELGLRGGHTVQREFTEIDWGNISYDARSFTSNPDLTKRVLEIGPSAFDERPKDAAPEDIIIFDVHRKKRNDVPAEKYIHVIQHDAENGLITYHEKEPVELIDASYKESKPGVFYEGDSDGYPQTQIFEHLHTGVFDDVPLYKEIPSVQKTMRALGLTRDDDSLTVSTPNEFVRRMNALRESDTSSGLHYPQVSLYPGSKMPKEFYIPRNAEGSLPVAKHEFSWFAHDAFTEHLLARIVYGEPLEDALSWYARGVQTLSSEQQAKATRSIDTFTDTLGGRSLINFERVYPVQKLYGGFDTISAVASIEDLKIVRWMREKDILKKHDVITDNVIINGFVAESKERLKV